MENPIDRSADGNGRTDVMLDELEGWISGEMVDVLVVPSDEIVESDDPVSLTDEPVAKM